MHSQPQHSQGEASGRKEDAPPRRHLYPAAHADRRPSHWWYWGRAIYVSRRDYWSIARVFLTAGLPLGAYGVLARDRRVGPSIWRRLDSPYSDTRCSGSTGCMDIHPCAITRNSWRMPACAAA